MSGTILLYLKATSIMSSDLWRQIDYEIDRGNFS